VIGTDLLSYTLFCTNNIHKVSVDLTAVKIPPSVFDKQSDSYEEYVDLDSLPSGIPDWAYRAIKEGRTSINRTDLAEFLDIFEATLGFFRLTIHGKKYYFFVYIAKGLEPPDIKYLKKFLDTDSPGIDANNKILEHMHPFVHTMTNTALFWIDFHSL
jgi:hypothetical protein